MRQFTYFTCKVTSLPWFAHFGMRICGDAQLLSCSHLVDHTRIMLDFHVNLIGPRSFWRDKTWHLLCISSFNCYSSSPVFQDPMNKSHFNLKLFMKIPQPTLSEMHSEQPFHRLGKSRVK